MTFKVNLSKTKGASSSGKSDIIATTCDNKALDGQFGDMKVGIPQADKNSASVILFLIFFL